ncbi:MAG: hypothetical protein COB66_05775 [Coxiella sp. (in: Bacteria)]|nr:MAG: hypothetical protein COB66_05775 [Coxiella sp. (in: g-proteobacteria)]
MKIKIYDIDGTLIKAKGENIAADDFDTYELWPLICAHFDQNPPTFQNELMAWRQSNHGIVGDVAMQRTIQMVQKSVDYMRPDVRGVDIRKKAKNLTTQFIEKDIVRVDAIAHMFRALSAGTVCVLSSGIFVEAIEGFVDGLMACDLLSPKNREQLIVSGSIANWETKEIRHLNLGDNKQAGLYDVCRARQVDVDTADIRGIYVDDPEGVDKGLCALNPAVVSLILTGKNKDSVFEQYQHVTWRDIIALEARARP